MCGGNRFIHRNERAKEQSALKAAVNPSNRAGQHVTRAILKAANDLKAYDTSLRLQWIPGHCANVGNDTTDRPTKEAAGTHEPHPF